jgi:superfamily II DNA or RNA helicase
MVPDEVFAARIARHTPRSLVALLSRWADRITVERGVRYAKVGTTLLLNSQWSNEQVLTVRGQVTGTQPEPYSAMVILEPNAEDWGEISGLCTCPVVYDCKHAVAVVWMWAKNVGILPPDSDDEVRTAKAAAPDVRKRFLPSTVDTWLRKTYEQSDDAPESSSKSSADRMGYAITPEGKLAVMKTRGNRAGEVKRSQQSASLAWIRHDHLRPAYVQEEDEPILRLMESTQARAEFAPQVRLIGLVGFQLLTMAINTQRAWFTGNEKTELLGTSLKMGERQKATLVWARAGEGDANFRLQAKVEGLDALCPILATTPTLAIDTVGARVLPIDVPLSTTTLERLLALPGLSDTDVDAWRFVADAWRALPDSAHIPMPPISLEPLPQPQGVLRFALVEINVTQGWGKHARETQIIAPAVEFTALYPDGRRLVVNTADGAAPLEDEMENSKVVGTRVRNVRAERTWSLRLPTRLLPLADVEPAVRYAMTPLVRSSLFALPRHGWASEGPQVLAQAQAAGFTLEIESGFPLTLEDIPEPELELIPAAQQGWYRFALGVQVGGVRVDLAPAFARLIAAQRDPELWLEALEEGDKVLLTLEDGRVVRLDGARVRAMLKPVLAWFQGGAVDEISGLQAALLPGQIHYRGRDADVWGALREKLQNGAALQAVSPAPGFNAQLRPYQASGLAWLSHLHELKMGAVLADDMGLGKTVQTLAHLHRAHLGATDGVPSLIIAPTSVVSNWRAEAERFVPNMRLHVHQGKSRALTQRELDKTDVVITSYPILQRDEATFAKTNWNVVVFDEAQTLKNPRAKTYQAAQAINARQRLALTGTPMENHLGELWSLFNVLSPGLLSDLETFNRHFRHRIEQNSDNERMNVLRSRVRPFLLRRTRDEVLKELPEKTESIRWIDFEPQQADVYESLRTAIHDDVRKAIDKKGLKQSTIHILDALLKLRQVCCDPRLVKLPDVTQTITAPSAKLDWLVEHVPILVEEGRRVLIFSQFTSMLAIIEREICAAGIETVLLTGDTKDRDTPIARFQNGEVPVFLLSLKAGGVGLNLTAADTVIHYDPWWNPAVEAQATARAHRIGQDKPVFVYKLIARGTLEERMLKLIERKQQLAEALLAGGSAALTGITAKDVDDLLSPIETLVPEKAD